MRQTLFNFKFIFLSTALLLLLSSCGSSKKISKKKSGKSEEVTTESVQKKSKKDKVVNGNLQQKSKVDKIMVYLGDESVVKWKLITINNQSASELYTNLPVMRFDEPWKQIYGSTGCNKFTAYYVRDNNVIAVSRLSATETHCDNGNEPLFLDLLSGINEVKEEGNTLSLLNNGQELLIFERF